MQPEEDDFKGGRHGGLHNSCDYVTVVVCGCVEETPASPVDYCRLCSCTPYYCLSPLCPVPMGQYTLIIM